MLIGDESFKVICRYELLEVRTRLAKLEEAFKQATSDEVQSHLKFAIEHHKKKIQELEHKLM